MHKAATAKGRRRVGARHQQGATALEFALVFPVFFMLFYGILSFGFIGLARMSLQHAAEEGARSALAWQEGEGSQLTLRGQQARTVTCDSMQWLNRLGAGCDVVINICDDAVLDCGSAGTGSCDISTHPRCQLVVTAQYAYAAAPILPALPGFGIVVPNRLSAQARVVIDRRAL